MVSSKVTITNPTGIHARPASNLLNFTKKFKCTVTLKTENKTANCASIISLLALGAKSGTEIEVVCDGEDEATALPEIVKFIKELKD